jgi:diaminohydroxyphosphoribosylaminopyrimidine deaminase / 5-amino-6-(5-phosphoribosylamino)uracil reductase
MDDRAAMQRALDLAWNGWGRVGPNPLVGALVVRDGAVVGEGFHAEFGGPHGEVAALQAAGERARGADLVGTLEPCRHSGKTPPCTDAIVQAGIRRVVYGAADVDPAARGGADVLRERGVAVEAGVLADEARRQNAVFFHRHAVPERPFVALKLAQSLDGRIADRERRSQWITGPQARAHVHWMRAGFDAIAVAAGTAIADDPLLTARGMVVPRTAPVRVIFDRRTEVPLASQVYRTARQVPTLVVVDPGLPAERRRALEDLGASVLAADGHAAALAALRARGVASVLVEGGGVLAGRLLTADLVDRVYAFVAPLILGVGAVPGLGAFAGGTLAEARHWTVAERRALGDDHLLVLDRS